MKTFSAIIKYVVLPSSTLVGLIYGFDTYIISRAQTVVEPVKAKVELMIPAIDRIDKRTETIQNFLMEKK